MGEIIRFNHARASSSSRAAKAANLSALKPAVEARSVASTADHHSAGILLRWPHLVTRGTVVPTSDAIAASEGQSFTTARNESMSVMTRNLGQSVLKRKAILSLDGRNPLGHTVRMVESEAEAIYKREFRARVKESRVAAALKQWEIADALGMTQDKYKQYETRSLLPHHLIGRFCVICHINPEWLITGHGQKAIQPLRAIAHEPEQEAKLKPARKRRVA
jgi:hypothetical protein